MVVLFYFSRSEFLSGICGAGESGVEHILFAKDKNSHNKKVSDDYVNLKANLLFDRYV